MASLHSHGVFIIFTAITIVLDSLAASGNEFIDATCMEASVKRICDATLSPDACYNRFNHMIESNAAESQTAFQNSVRTTMYQLSKAYPDFAVNGSVEILINNSKPNNGLAFALSALGSCRELLSLAMNNLNMSLSCSIGTSECRGNLQSSLCAADSDLQTCVEGFDDLVQGVRNYVFEKLKSAIDLTANSNSIIGLLESCARDKPGQNPSTPSWDSYPRWLSSKDRRLLQDKSINANVVVAKDGSGKYTRVSDAVKAAPRLSNNRFVIYVKKGLYQENVKIEHDQWNILMFGDGMNQTIISSNLSHGGGASTLNTVTFSVDGQGFIARDIGFRNTAGAINGQAVALASTSDRSVFYKCRMDGYQDTLWARSHRQFYRECHIYGTIDFIFGAAAVVIQKSFIYARKPLHGQQNVITAHQGNAQCPSAIVVQSSTIQASEDLTGVSTYLGRPWSSYAKVVFIQNEMDKLIDPKGWLQWNGATPPSTIFFAEYNNKGSGAGTANRVKWAGVRSNLSSAEASKFTVGSLIQGNQWLPATYVPYQPSL